VRPGRLSGRCCAIGLGLLGLAVAFLLLALVWPWVSQNRVYVDNTQRQAQMLQRLRALAAQKPELEARLKQVQQDAAVTAFYLHADSTALAAAEVQGRIKRAIEATEGKLVSTQTLPVKDDGSNPQIAIRVRMTGDVDALASVLYNLESEPPLLFLDNLSVRVQRTRVRRSRRVRSPRLPTVQSSLDATLDVSAYLWTGKRS